LGITLAEVRRIRALAGFLEQAKLLLDHADGKVAVLA
jgi:hypothetical protein